MSVSPLATRNATIKHRVFVSNVTMRKLDEVKILRGENWTAWNNCAGAAHELKSGKTAATEISTIWSMPLAIGRGQFQHESSTPFLIGILYGFRTQFSFIATNV